jgi:hypothetical protein
MEDSDGPTARPRFWSLFLPTLLVIAAIVAVQKFQAASGEPAASATYSHGVVDLTIPYHAAHAGAGKLTVEILNPEDQILGSADQSLDIAEGKGQWREKIKLAKPLAVEELVWHRVRYRFEYSGGKMGQIEGTEAISQILRRPVVHILGQQAYLAGGKAAVRVIATDSEDDVLAGHGSVQIELLVPDQKNRLLFTGRLNRRGTVEAQFRFPSALVASRYGWKTRFRFSSPPKSQSTSRARPFTYAHSRSIVPITRPPRIAS